MYAPLVFFRFAKGFVIIVHIRGIIRGLDKLLADKILCILPALVWHSRNVIAFAALVASSIPPLFLKTTYVTVAVTIRYGIVDDIKATIPK